MARLVDHVLADILVGIERIEEVATGAYAAGFAEDWRIYWLVQRGLEIISEASRAIPDDMQILHPEVPWRQVRSFGNALQHEYNGLSSFLIWNVVTEELPGLKAAIVALRKQNS